MGNEVRRPFRQPIDNPLRFAIDIARKLLLQRRLGPEDTAHQIGQTVQIPGMTNLNWRNELDESAPVQCLDPETRRHNEFGRGAEPCFFRTKRIEPLLLARAA